MKLRRVSFLSLLAASAAMATMSGTVGAVAAPPGVRDDADDIQVLTRGPVHEAFAETVTFDPEPGIVVAKTPPAAIEELPPGHKPVGANVSWIPGYWAWDDDSEDFLWVSGIWRAIPPGRQWVPGYWARAGNGSQWISGYWADAGLTEVEYLPEPPESVEAGPNTDAPTAGSVWLPGCWVWQQDRYAWRPGFWSPQQQDWVWTPAHYQWSPRGYVCVDGYWDYEVSRRGVLFAPVSIDHGIRSRQGFSYTPSVVISLGTLASHLFLRPDHGHYYFGDYYAANYATAGYYPSHTYHSGHRGYDPIYAHRRWEHRTDRDWERRVQTDYQHRRDHEDARPPRTFAAQQTLLRKGPVDQDGGRVVAQPLEPITKAGNTPSRFQPVDALDRERLIRQRQEARAHQEERQKLETQAANVAAGRPAGKIEPARSRLPRSPFVGGRADSFAKDQRPPDAHVAPPPDLKIVPRTRQPISRTQTQPREPVGRKTELPQKPPAGVAPVQTPKLSPKPVTPGPGSQPMPKGGPQGKSRGGAIPSKP